MGRRRYSYNQTYRGRQEGSVFLRMLAIILAVLLVIGVAVLVYITSQYLEYTDEGPKLNLPWLQHEPQDSAPPAVSDLIITSDNLTVEPSESAPPEPVPLPRRYFEVEPAALVDGSAQERAVQAGADALVVRVKDEEGNLAWHSALELAQEDMNGSEAFGGAVRQLAHDGKLHLTARLTGFQDLWTSVYRRELAILNRNGKLWYDSAGISWISLADAQAQAYITDLCMELAQLGFDEILLEHAGYPDNGRVSKIPTRDNYPAQGREEAVGAFLAALSEKLSQSGVMLSVQAAYTSPEEAAPSGVTAAALSGLAGRIWLPKDADIMAWSSALAQAGAEEREDRLVAAEPLDQGATWNGSVLLVG